MENEMNKKREISFGEGEGEGDEDDEKKMDKFYELIRRFREERNRRRSELINDLEINNSKKIRSSPSSSSSTEQQKNQNQNQKQNQKQSSWAPSFKLEDFTDEEIQFVKPPLIFPSPTNTMSIHHHNKHEQQQDIDDGLTLKLAL